MACKRRAGASRQAALVKRILNRLLSALGLCLIWPATSAPAELGCARVAVSALLGDVVALAPTAPASRIVGEAIRSWQRCPEYGGGFPAFVIDPSRPDAVHVRYDRGSSQGARCAFFTRREIVLYGSALDRGGKAVPCSPPAVLLAHELGHVLGLGDAPPGGRCQSAIMAADDPRLAARRAVQREECAAADGRWRTPRERRDGEDLAAAASPAPPPGGVALDARARTATELPR